MDYSQYIPPVLAVLGSLLQYVRQYKSVNDGWVGLGAFLMAVGAYSVAHVYTPDWRLEVLSGVVVVAGYTSNVLGGTFVGSRLASAGVSAFPVTNSK